MADTDLTGLSEINALLGAGTEYEGKLVFQGRVRVDGRFVGEISGTDVLILGATAQVQANIDVGTLIVLGGTLRGDVVARRLVELHAPGAVHGDIQTPQLFIDKGATFTGTCSMGDVATEVVDLAADAAERPPALAHSDAQGGLTGSAATAEGTSTSERASALGLEPSAVLLDADEPFVRAPTEEAGEPGESAEPGDQRKAPRT